MGGAYRFQEMASRCHEISSTYFQFAHFVTTLVISVAVAAVRVERNHLLAVSVVDDEVVRSIPATFDAQPLANGEEHGQEQNARNGNYDDNNFLQSDAVSSGDNQVVLER